MGYCQAVRQLALNQSFGSSNLSIPAILRPTEKLVFFVFRWIIYHDNKTKWYPAMVKGVPLFCITNTNIRNIWLDLFFTLSIVIAYLKASACEIPNTIHPSLNSCTKSFGFAPQIRVQDSLIQVFCCLYRLLLSFAILLNTNSSNKQHRPKMKSDLR